MAERDSLIRVGVDSRLDDNEFLSIRPIFSVLTRCPPLLLLPLLLLLLLFVAGGGDNDDD